MTNTMTKVKHSENAQISLVLKHLESGNGRRGLYAVYRLEA